MKNSNNDQPESILVVAQGPLHYSLASSSSSLLSDDEVLVAHETEDDEIYQLENNDQYLLEVYEDNYMLSDKIDIDCDNYESSLSDMEDYEVPAELIEQVDEMIQQQNAIGNDEFEIAVFAPAYSTIETPPDDSSNISVLANVTYDEVPYTHGGYNMRAYVTKTWNANTDMKPVTGNPRDIAMNSFNLVISVAGLASTYVSYFGVGVSALQFFESLVKAKVSYGSANDAYSMMLVYENIKDRANLLWRCLEDSRNYLQGLAK